jgi:hypothetical protein
MSFLAEIDVAARWRWTLIAAILGLNINLTWASVPSDATHGSRMSRLAWVVRGDLPVHHPALDRGLLVLIGLFWPESRKRWLPRIC